MARAFGQISQTHVAISAHPPARWQGGVVFIHWQIIEEPDAAIGKARGAVLANIAVGIAHGGNHRPTFAHHFGVAGNDARGPVGVIWVQFHNVVVGNAEAVPRRGKPAAKLFADSLPPACVHYPVSAAETAFAGKKLRDPVKVLIVNGNRVTRLQLLDIQPIFQTSQPVAFGAYCHERKKAICISSARHSRIGGTSRS